MAYKGTKGVWKVGRKSTKNNDGRFQCYVDSGVIQTNPVCTVFSKTSGEADANCEMIVDAGNTVIKTGLLPSEILKQRDEAVEMLKNVLKLRSLIEYPKDVEEKHSLEALAIFGMLNNIESVIKSITESK